MPAKKTTAKKTTAKKTTTKKAVAKKPTSVVVEKKVSTAKTDSCSTCCSHVLPTVLLIINTVLLVVLIIGIKSMVNNSLEKFEALRIGGAENHAIMKEIYGMDAYKQDQKMRLEQTVQQFQNMANQGQPQADMPTDQVDLQPEQQ